MSHFELIRLKIIIEFLNFIIIVNKVGLKNNITAEFGSAFQVYRSFYRIESVDRKKIDPTVRLLVEFQECSNENARGVLHDESHTTGTRVNAGIAGNEGDMQHEISRDKEKENER